jgi:nucleotide-binding universal stress UspA family protein
MKRRIILIPLDGSAFSRAIIPHIPRLFDPEAHSLVLFRVAELPAGITSAPPWPMASTWAVPTHITARDFERARFPIYDSQEEQSARDALECALGEAARTLEKAGYQVSVAVRFGDPAEEIATFVKAAHVDLVAMATHGRTGIRQLVLGSVAEQVLRTIDVPVVLIRPHEDLNNDHTVIPEH